MLKIEKNIISLIQEALKEIFPHLTVEMLKSVYLEIPKEKGFGDFSTNIAMRLAGQIKKPPQEAAGLIVEKLQRLLGKGHISSPGHITEIKVEKPGFINFYISNKCTQEALIEILSEGDTFGSLSIGKGKKVQIEFVSANPTGFLTVAHGRQAAIGDSLARIMGFCGYKVTREYYINDEGVQMNILGESVKARFLELKGEKVNFPENGYKGDYIIDIAKEIRGIKHTDEFFTDYAYKWIMRTIEKDLEDFGVHFDVWYSQKELARSGKIEQAFKILKKKGFLYDQDGATWFKSTNFGDDKDRVVVKKDGSFTYLAPDIAYHRDKFERGYNRVINIWGPDHHGYIPRLKAACETLGFDKENVSILIAQLVTLYRDKKPVRMSTREGQFITLRELIDEVGRDAARFFFIMRRTDSHLDFDLELAKAKTMDNPVYYIQYAHARIFNVLKFAGSRTADLKNLRLLDKDMELAIIKMLMQFPKIIHSSCKNLEPYILLSYLQNLASLFHSYYDAHRIVTDDDSLTKARLSLVTAIKNVLYNGLTLLGVKAPEKM